MSVAAGDAPTASAHTRAVALGGSGGSPIVAIGVLVVGLALFIGAAIAGAPLLAVAALTVGLLGVGAFARPEVATLAVIGVIYSNAAVVAVTIHEAPFVVAAAVPALLLAPLAYHLLVRREPVIVTPALPFVLAYFLAQLLATMSSSDPRAAGAELAVFVSEGFALYLLVTNVIREVDTLRRIVWVLLIVGAVLGSISLIQQLAGTADNDFLGFGQTDASFGTGQSTLAGEVRQPRLAGPIGEQNRYAQIMLMLVPLGMMQFFAERTILARLAMGACTVLAALGSTLGFSRGAFIGFALLLVAMTVLRYVRARQLAFVGACMVLVALVVPQIGSRIQTLDPIMGVVSNGIPDRPDDSVLSRVTENVAALLVVADHPLLGVGPGQFPQHYREYAAEVALLTKAEDREAHNLYLDVAAETGLLGLAAFLGAVLVTLGQLARARRRWLRDRPDIALLATGLSLALLTYLATGLFLHLSYERYFWLMLALGGAAAWVALRGQADVLPRGDLRRAATGRRPA
jgi:O-antigen ligase